MSLPVRDLIPVTFFVQFLISVLIYFGGRGQHEVDANGVDIFRIKPSIAWMVTIASFCCSAILGFGIFSLAQNPSGAPISLMLGEALLFFFGLYGLYCVKLRIRVDARAIRVKTLFGDRLTNLRDIGSVDDKVTGRYRTLNVLDLRGKRVIRITSTFFPDYDELVDLIKNGVGRK
jgi:hypothetical protein